MFEKVKDSLERAGYKVSCFDTKEEAASYLDGQVDGKTIGFGGSMTLREMELDEKLKKHNTLFWHWGKDAEEADEMRKQAALADVYFSSANGLAETGEIINIDGNGNRVAAICYGHDKVYFVIGRNKIAPDYDSALYRARNIAAPMNARRFQVKTPCVAGELRCYNCKSPARICRALSVLWEAPRGCEYEVVLINEDLGY